MLEVLVAHPPELYITGKVEKLCKDMLRLSTIVKLTHRLPLLVSHNGLWSKKTYLTMSIKGISHLLQPLNDIIRKTFILGPLQMNI